MYRGAGASGGQAADVGNDRCACWKDNIHWIVLIAVVSAICGCCFTLCFQYFVRSNAASKPIETTHAKTVEMESKNDVESPKDAQPDTEGDSTQEVPDVVYSD